MVVQAARVASGQFSRQGGDHGPTLPPAQSGALCHTQRPSTLLRPFSVLLQLTSSCLHSCSKVDFELTRHSKTVDPITAMAHFGTNFPFFMYLYIYDCYN